MTVGASPQLKKPNFFLIGAPKCGTTSLALYLSGHPNLFFCDPKEPFYWNSDYPELRRKEHLHTLAEYEALFSEVSEQETIVAEGSTTYLSSQTAVREILDYNPDALFLAMLRNPVEAMRSFHSELVYTSNEEVEDFEEAWNLQSRRAAGESIPKLCREPTWLQYRKMGSYASQVRRFFELVPEAQRRVFLFDDYSVDTPGTYRQVLEFLGLPDDNRQTFPRLKQSRKKRFEFVHRFFRVPPKPLEPIAIRVRRYVANQHSGPVGAAKKLFVKSHKRPPLREEFVEYLKNEFHDDVMELSELLGRDLSHWVD
ncbi:MAG: sulfotransferase domain-containing protein [Lacipirellulaceae bacterium]